MQLESGNVSLNDFNKIEDCVVSNDSKFQAYVLFSYSKRSRDQDIISFRETIKKDLEIENAVKIGSLKPSKNLFSIRVSSKPEGALLKIDGEIWGENTIEINHKMSIGKHVITLEHPLYKDYYDEIVIYSDMQNEFLCELERLVTEFNIGSTETGSKIYINDKFMGYTPKKGEDLLLKKT